jgi:hypothetical protein
MEYSEEPVNVGRRSGTGLGFFVVESEREKRNAQWERKAEWWSYNRPILANDKGKQMPVLCNHNDLIIIL